MAGTSARFVKGWGEMNREGKNCSAGGRSSMVASVMASLGRICFSVEPPSETATPWVWVETVEEVTPVSCFVVLGFNQH